VGSRTKPSSVFDALPIDEMNETRVRGVLLQVACGGRLREFRLAERAQVSPSVRRLRGLACLLPVVASEVAHPRQPCAVVLLVDELAISDDGRLATTGTHLARSHSNRHGPTRSFEQMINMRHELRVRKLSNQGRAMRIFRTSLGAAAHYSS